MGTEQVLVGNMAMAAILIKTILSSVKMMTAIKPLYLQLATMLLGIGAAFALDIELVKTVDPSQIIALTQKIFSGLFIGASAMGVHESTKVLKPNAK